MDTEKLYELFLKTGKVATDSRRIEGGELFFALKGENFNGNKFAAAALERGAAYAVVDEMPDVPRGRIILVPDVLSSLQKLARFHREHLLSGGRRIPVVGLTGTNGKTTTKNLLKAVLSKKYRVCATEGNLNNDIGVPLSLLKMDSDTEIAVIEMGASHPDDIAVLVELARPDFGIITNVGKAHLQGFGSFEGVKRAKGKLYDFLCAHGGTAFVNADDPVLMRMASERTGMKTVPYGMDADGASLLPSTADNPFLRLRLSDGVPVDTRLVGAYNCPNVLAALSAGRYFGVSESLAVEAVESFVPDNIRSQMIKTGRNTLIVDAYNANPSSMAAALDNFRSVEGNRKIVMLGDMRELGPDSVAEHAAVIRLLDSMSLDGIFLVGEEFRKASDVERLPSCARLFESSEKLAEELSREAPSGAVILIKGSRGVQMEKVVPFL